LNRKTTLILALAVLVALVAITAASVASAKPTKTAATSLKGAGSSFVAPLVSQWKEHYSKADISYNPIGSGGGIQAIQNRNVDFGASDAPMTPDQFSGCHGCVQIPWALSATSIPYNIPGVSYGLKITGPLLADIYLGKISKWNDKRLKAINKGVNLPDLKITPVFRSDSSGTTFNVTDYLSHVSPAFKRKIGNSTLVNFPVGTGAKGSSGVSGTVGRIDGSLGYVDVAYSLAHGLKFMKVKNKDGKYALPGLTGIKAAAATVRKVPKNNALSIVDPPKSQKRAYPICTFTYVILPMKTSNAAALKTFVAWAMTTGQTFGPKLKFYPIPKVVRTAGRTTLKKVHS
jgi:phosphate transport system substrate-binding protein